MKNWTAPPGICMYWDPRVVKPKEEMTIDVNYVASYVRTADR